MKWRSSLSYRRRAECFPDWGADFIKIERPVPGDTQRGFISPFGRKVDPLRNGMMKHPELRQA
ncbi:CoA transferase [Novosphingobium sp. G106]|uniref:CoA transferase n=1 Tax=Novosphingobium sp. G106 TaxID=2849500 RepID=UPI001C2D79D2|nr:CoA transferase [Novosphingobium sp. G106]MBV1691823.1 CoA transferase [Novosphingobium sp. G106]